MKRILIIEDDEDIVNVIRVTLERERFGVAAMHGGASEMAVVRPVAP